MTCTSSNDDVPVFCPICNTPARVLDSSYPGYREATSFGIASCEACALSFALPTVSDSSLYETIYAQRDAIPGYNRYEGYARAVSRALDPLAYLADKEESYWAVRRTIATLPPNGEILDVGSGLGYVTYALARAGLRATGLDLSERAVSSASTRFGDFYVAADFFDWAKRYPERYALVLMLELIEHVESPIEWLATALSLTKPGGKLLLSTPNRDYYAHGTIWETEAPPVHLWWFSEAFFRQFGRTHGIDVEIVDLQGCPIRSYAAPMNIVRTRRSPILARNGWPTSRLRRALYRLRLLDFATKLYTHAGELRRRRNNVASPRRESLVVIFHKRA